MKSLRFLPCQAVFLGTVLTGSFLAASEEGGITDEPAVNPDPEHLVWIKPGAFLMGSPESERSLDNETPQTRVTISRGVSMGKYEVTQGQYEAVMGSNPSVFKGSPNLPVENVSWMDATNFCARLTEQEHQAGRLPAGYV